MYKVNLGIRSKNSLSNLSFVGQIYISKKRKSKTFTGKLSEIKAAKWVDLQLIKAGLDPINGFYKKLLNG